MSWKVVFSVGLLCSAALTASAQEADDVPVQAPAEVVETGLIKHVLPRFSLKTGIRLRLVEIDGAVVIGTEGTPLMEGLGQTWYVRHDESPRATRFAEWLTSEIGQRTIASFAPDGTAPFGPPTEIIETADTMTFDGDPVMGRKVSEVHCKRCHAVAPGQRFSDIGSTPSFFVLRTLADWPDRFAAFFALNPHPAFTQVEEVTAPFPDNLPSPIAPIEMTLEEVDAVLAYVASLKAADLGDDLVHQ